MFYFAKWASADIWFFYSWKNFTEVCGSEIRQWYWGYPISKVYIKNVPIVFTACVCYLPPHYSARAADAIIIIKYFIQTLSFYIKNKGLVHIHTAHIIVLYI